MGKLDFKKYRVWKPEARLLRNPFSENSSSDNYDYNQNNPEPVSIYQSHISIGGFISAPNEITVKNIPSEPKTQIIPEPQLQLQSVQNAQLEKTIIKQAQELLEKHKQIEHYVEQQELKVIELANNSQQISELQQIINEQNKKFLDLQEEYAVQEKKTLVLQAEYDAQNKKFIELQEEYDFQNNKIQDLKQQIQTIQGQQKQFQYNSESFQNTNRQLEEQIQQLEKLYYKQQKLLLEEKQKNLNYEQQLENSKILYEKIHIIAESEKQLRKILEQKMANHLPQAECI